MSINDTIPGKVGQFDAMIASGPVIIQERDGVLRTLLVKHGEKPIHELKWKFPGGKLVHGMTLEENAALEAKQEVGVHAILHAAIKPMVLWNEVPETGSSTPEVIVLIHFIATLNEEPVAGPEILAMEWFALDALPSDASPNIAPVIAEYLRMNPDQ